MWPVALAFFAALFGMLVANAMLLGVVIAFYHQRGQGSALESAGAWATSLVGLCASASVTGVVLAGVSLSFASLGKEPVATRLTLFAGLLRAPQIAAAAVVTFGAGIVFSQLADVLGFADSGVLAVVAKSVNEASWPAWSASLVGLALVPGIAEELFFRGFVQTRAVSAWGPVRGILLSSVLFGLFHMDPKQGLYAMLVGAFLGWVAHRAGSIRPAMLAHGTSNALGLCMSRAGVGASGTAGKVATISVACVVIAAALFMLARTRRPEDPSLSSPSLR